MAATRMTRVTTTVTSMTCRQEEIFTARENVILNRSITVNIMIAIIIIYNQESKYKELKNLIQRIKPNLYKKYLLILTITH